MKGTVLIMTIILLLGVVLPSQVCSQEEELILRVAMQDDIRTTNPLNAGGVWTWNVLQWLYDSPVFNDFETDEQVPYIAVGSANRSTDLSQIDWSDCTIGTFGYNPKDTWADQNKSEATIFYDFTGVTWHDGTQMTIRDVLFSYHVAAQMPSWGGTKSDIECIIIKYERVGISNKTPAIETVYESPDGMNAALKFILQKPFHDFFEKTLAIFLLPYHIWGTTLGNQDFDDSKIFCDPGYSPDLADAWSVEDATAWDNPSPVGSGPFEWDYWDAAGGISKITTYRDHFYKSGYKYNQDARQPYIDGIVFKIYRTAEAAVLALKNNDVDYIAWSVPPTFVGDLASEEGITLHQSPEQSFYYLAYNMRRESFGYDEEKSFPYSPEDDVGKPFRRAVAHCIDKNRIVQRLLLHFGVAGEGPISSVSSWYNASIPKYNFDPDEAITILTEAGYQLTDGPGSTPGPSNWWLNPDGSEIARGGGPIHILTPQAHYDPIRAQAGLMIARQLQEIGINAESRAMDFGSIVDRIDQRDFDVYILGWRINDPPSDFLHAFFHSTNAVAGQNYPGYQNKSFDDIIDHSRLTEDENERKQDIFDAQSAIAYDLPYDVLYFKTNIEAYRSDRFVGWKTTLEESIINIDSIYHIRPPGPWRLTAQFLNIPSAMYSNQTIPVNVLVKDQDRLPFQGAEVVLNASSGKLTEETGVTISSGMFSTFFTAPYVPPTQDNINNGTTVILNIREATYEEEDRLYDSAPSKIILIKIYPTDVEFLSVTMSAEPDVIDPDVDEDGTFGFTIVEVEVKLHTDVNPSGDPDSGIEVYITVSPEVPNISPESATTDGNGKATFTVTSTDLPDDDGSQYEFQIYADAVHPTNSDIKQGDQVLTVHIVDAVPLPPTPDPRPFNMTLLMIGGLISVVLVITMLLVVAILSGRRKLKR